MKRVENEITGRSTLIECDLITDKNHELCPLHELERGPKQKPFYSPDVAS